VIEYGQSSSQSDVWSFGVCLWEMFSYGKIPYSELSNNEVVSKVLAGYRLEAPLNCPPEVYKIMTSCWQLKPESRPTFSDLMTEINAMVVTTNLMRESYVLTPESNNTFYS
jgi:serine/threonine protein kinase